MAYRGLARNIPEILKLRWTSPFELIGKTDIPTREHAPIKVAPNNHMVASAVEFTATPHGKFQQDDHSKIRDKEGTDCRKMAPVLMVMDTRTLSESHSGSDGWHKAKQTCIRLRAPCDLLFRLTFAFLLRALSCSDD